MTVSNWLTLVSILGPCLAGAYIVRGIVAMGGLKIARATNALLVEQNAALHCGYADLQAKYEARLADIGQANLKIAALEGKVSILESIPLQNIDTTLKLILDVLKGSEHTLAVNTKAAVLAANGVADSLAAHDAAAK